MRLASMGLSDFVALFYGSAQNLHSSKSASTFTSSSTSSSTYSLPTAAEVNELRQMLKNHKNVLAKKYSYKDYPNELKYGKNITANIQYATPAAGGGGSGAKKLLNNNNNKSHNNNNNNSKVNTKIPKIPTKATPATPAASRSELDLYRAGSGRGSGRDVGSGSGVGVPRSKSSLLWNSFRLPRKPKAAAESLRFGVDQTELQELNGPAASSPSVAPSDAKSVSINDEDHSRSRLPESQSTDTKADSTEQFVGATEVVKGNAQPTPSLKAKFDTPTSATDPTGKDLAKCPNLRPFIKNGIVDFLRLDKFLLSNKEKQHEQERNVTGLGIMVQYMNEELDAFACKDIKDECAKAKCMLEETIKRLQEAQRSCEEMRQQLHDKDVEWLHHEQELEEMLAREQHNAKRNLEETQMLAKGRYRELEEQIHAKDEEKKQAIQAYNTEMSLKLSHKQNQLTAAEEQVLRLRTCLQKSEEAEQELREKLTRKENTHASRLAAVTQNEQELSERVRKLTKELDTLKSSKEHNERDLRDRLALSHDEISVLRTSTRRSLNESTCSSTSSNAELSRLTSEANSLRSVLELKQAEISALSKKNAELKRENDERVNAQQRINALEAQNEMLRTELEAKTDKEKDYQRQIDDLQKAYNHENVKRQRLTFDKEELQWTLKQRSEQLQLIEAKFHEFSSQENSFNSTHLRSTAGQGQSNGKDQVSPPASPVIKGVIEKNDSVSWVLELDDETPEAAASKIVKRAGSLRCCSERSPTQRRQLSVSVGHNGGSPAATATQGPNPLSQSMSAAAVMRSHSSESDSRPVSRARSHSVCIKSACENGAMAGKSPASRHTHPRRQRSGSELQLPDWHPDALCSSSPNQEAVRPRSSTMKASSSESRSELFSRGSKASTLITCDSSALTSGERLELHPYPKALKKFQEIQESAGEAMVSGANSEDESCSASSEDMPSSASSTASASSSAGPGSLSKQQQQQSRMSIEEALLLERGSSLNGTPMEVSWSEDAADASEAAYHNGA